MFGAEDLIPDGDGHDLAEDHKTGSELFSVGKSAFPMRVASVHQRSLDLRCRKAAGFYISLALHHDSDYKLMDRGRIPGGITKRIKISAVVCLALILCQGCGSFLMKKRAEQKLPLDRKLTITRYEIDEKQRLYLTLHDSSDNVSYIQRRIKPDSIICYIDGRVGAPTLEINEVYVQQTEYRYYDHDAQRYGPRRPETPSPDEPFATIYYRVPVRIFLFTFPSKQLFESWIPEKLRKKAYLKFSTPLKLKLQRGQKSIRHSHLTRPSGGFCRLQQATIAYILLKMPDSFS